MNQPDTDRIFAVADDSSFRHEALALFRFHDIGELDDEIELAGRRLLVHRVEECELMNETLEG